MIDIESVLRGIPSFDAFCSVAQLHELVEKIGPDERFEVKVVGTSANGVNIHHVRCGSGSVKALIVAFPHCMEPIGGLTVFSLLTLLHQGNRDLLEADVEWHIVPCIDPDGALLNEGWSQKPFSLETYLDYRYVQASGEQVDTSFPITYKNLVTRCPPSREASVLQGILDQVRPDFFFSLHNSHVGGAFFFLSRDIDRKYHQSIYELLEKNEFPIQGKPIWGEFCAQFGKGICELSTIRMHYDYLERTTSRPEDFVNYGAASWDYLAEINPSALTFVAELSYGVHPQEESEKSTGMNLRKFKLRQDADSKFLASVVFEEWEKVKGDLDASSPLYRSVVKSGTLRPGREKISEGGMPLSRYPTREILLNPSYDRLMTESDRFQACMVDGGFTFLLFVSRFIRLLKVSQQTEAIRGAIRRLEEALKEASEEISRTIDFSSFKAFDYTSMARVQLGSGLIALNSVLEGHSARSPDGLR